MLKPKSRFIWLYVSFLRVSYQKVNCRHVNIIYGTLPWRSQQKAEQQTRTERWIDVWLIIMMWLITATPSFTGCKISKCEFVRFYPTIHVSWLTFASKWNETLSFVSTGEEKNLHLLSSSADAITKTVGRIAINLYRSFAPNCVCFFGVITSHVACSISAPFCTTDGKTSLNQLSRKSE